MNTTNAGNNYHKRHVYSITATLQYMNLSNKCSHYKQHDRNKCHHLTNACFYHYKRHERNKRCHLINTTLNELITEVKLEITQKTTEVTSGLGNTKNGLFAYLNDNKEELENETIAENYVQPEGTIK